VVAKFLVGLAGVLISVGSICAVAVICMDLLQTIPSLHVFSDVVWAMVKILIATTLFWVAWTAWPIR
jgi:hypothetical protein